MTNPWDLIVKQYDIEFGNEGDYSHKFIIYPSILNILGKVDKKYILDMGCGTGTLSRILSKKGAIVSGIDNSKEMIKVSIEKNIFNDDSIKYSVSDARKKLKFEDKSFDTVLQVMLLHSIEDKYLKETFDETNRILKDHGQCILVIPHPSYVKEFKSVGYPSGELYLTNHKTNFAWKQFNEICKAPTEFYMRPLEYYSELFENTGFIIKRIYEPKIIKTKDAMIAKPNNFNRRREIPQFMVIKLIKLPL